MSHLHALLPSVVVVTNGIARRSICIKTSKAISISISTMNDILDSSFFIQFHPSTAVCVVFNKVTYLFCSRWIQAPFAPRTIVHHTLSIDITCTFFRILLTNGNSTQCQWCIPVRKLGLLGTLTHTRMSTLGIVHKNVIQIYENTWSSSYRSGWEENESPRMGTSLAHGKSTTR